MKINNLTSFIKLLLANLTIAMVIFAWLVDSPTPSYAETSQSNDGKINKECLEAARVFNAIGPSLLAKIEELAANPDRADDKVLSLSVVDPVALRNAEDLSKQLAPTVSLDVLTVEFNSVVITENTLTIDLPKTTITQIKVGQFPTYNCIGMTCSVKWQDILASVPEIKMVKTQTIVKLPSVTLGSIALIMITRKERDETDAYITRANKTIAKLASAKLDEKRRENLSEILATIRINSAASGELLLQCVNSQNARLVAQSLASADVTNQQISDELERLAKLNGASATSATTFDFTSAKKQIQSSKDRIIEASRRVDELNSAVARELLKSKF